MEKLLQKALEQIEQLAPGAAALGLKVVLCILAYVIGKRLISWIVHTMRKMLERTQVQAGAVTFAVSMVKITLYILLVLSIAMQ
ncbi:MAG: hypothetical protein PUF13_05045, partial [Lachnospiraceae bacterium]|nr:hypothetical protein [Lachnospiraceae bacterium]